MVMAGIDHKRADIALRERFSVPLGEAGALAAALKRAGPALGCVVLSTCNRTEVYLSLEEGAESDPGMLLCDRLGVPYKEASFTVRRGRSCLKHLMMVAAGLRSLVRGEDQILTQVKEALAAAREASAVDPVLETAFRTAVTAAKRAKTVATLPAVESSAAHRALSVLEKHTALAGSRALVIGCGEMGRLMAGLLRDAGCDVAVTLRSYKRGAAVPPGGCRGIPYEGRYQALEGCSILIGATASPHFTIRATELADCGNLPDFIVDLAVPRDIQPEAAALARKAAWSLDDLGGNIPGPESAAKLREILAVFDHYADRYDRWTDARVLLHAGMGKPPRKEQCPL